MTSAAASPRSRQREQTRDQILRAAIKLFARSGFDAASLGEIAREAGVKKALVQYHFSTKDQLWREAAGNLWQARNRQLLATRAGGSERDGIDSMRRGFTTLVEFTREHPEWLWFMFHEAASGGERMRWLLDQHIRCDYALGEKFIRQCQEEGLIRKGPPLHLLHLITGALTYNLLVARQTLEASGTDLASADSIALQVELLAQALAP